MEWWLWIFFGLALLALELFLPTGFFVFLIGIGAVATGLVVFIGLGGPAWLHWILFVLFSSALLMYVRSYMMGRTDSGEKDADRGPQGQTVTLTTDVEPRGVGSGELRGASWSLRNDGAESLKVGQRCVVTRVEGIMLVVGGSPSSENNQ